MIFLSLNFVAGVANIEEYIFLAVIAKGFQSSGFSHVQIPVRWASRAQGALTKILDTHIRDIQLGGTWKEERVITTKQASEIKVQGRSDKLLNFCANNYLGLSVSACSHFVTITGTIQKTCIRYPPMVGFVS